MSSPLSESGTRDNPPSSTRRALPVPPVLHTTRKAPPSPLAISSSSLSPHSLPSHVKSSSSASTSPNARNSLESSTSDLTSVRSDLTSLHISEFPAPPSGLPPIPASPQTPRSLYFSTTPTTPRSRSPQSGFALQLQDPPDDLSKAEIKPSRSPRSLKFFSRSRSQSPQPKFAHQERDPAGPTEFQAPANSKLGYDSSRVDVPAHYSQYAVYKESNIKANASSPATPTTAGTLGTRDWQSSSGRTSPLQPPRPVYTRSDFPIRSQSPLRNESSFATQQEDRLHDIQGSASNGLPMPSSPRNVSPQPPRSPLPVPPSPRDSARNSARYSHIARNAGVTDMGMDISEEQLLSTDFITEMLRQPIPSSPRSARFLRLPDSKRSSAFSNLSSDDAQGAKSYLTGNEMHHVPAPYPDLASPGFFVPQTESVGKSGLQSQMRHLDGRTSPQTPEPVTTSPLGEDGTEDRTGTRRFPSGLASSVFPSGGDRIYLDDPLASLPVSPNPNSLLVPAHTPRNHTSPHPSMPLSPMSRESFTSAISPGSPRGFSQAQGKHLPSALWRNSSTSQTIASRLPIGKPLPSSASGSATGQKTVVPRVASARIRHHRYPRPSANQQGLGQRGQLPDSAPVQSTAEPSSPTTVASAPSADSIQFVGDRNGHPTQVKPVIRSAITSDAPSAISNTSSTRTQRDSSTTLPGMVESRYPSSDVPAHSETQTNSRRSYDSNFLPSTDSMSDDDETTEVEGEVQTASRAWSATAPAASQAGIAANPTVVGVAPAVIVHRNPVESTEVAATTAPQNDARLDVDRPISGFQSEASVPPSPRTPPSVYSPPSHRTDIPESAKSVYFSEDVHGPKHPTYLPYEEVAGYGSPHTFLNVNPSASSDVPSRVAPPRRRPSTNAGSFKSVVSYITSRSGTSTVASRATKVSHKSTQSTNSSRWAWLKRKPLPPIPSSAQPSNTLDEVISKSLLSRGARSQIPEYDDDVALGQGQYQKSKVSLAQPGEPQGWSDTNMEKWPGPTNRTYGPPRMTFIDPGGKFEMLAEDSLKVARRKSRRQTGDVQKPPGSSGYESRPADNVTSNYQQRQRASRRFPSLGRSYMKKRIWFPFIGVVVMVIVLSATLGATLGRKRGAGGAPASCSGDKAGVHCDLDATCTCPSLRSGTCAAPLAQVLSDLVPVASQLFTTNITDEAMAIVIWESQGTPITSNCALQANLVDVGSILDESTSPNRTQWAQAALLWNLYQSGDIQATRDMQSTVEKLPFHSLNSKDGAVADSSGTFDVSSLGYTFNFANQTVNPPFLKFQDVGSPSSAQAAEVNSLAENSLDRMYSFASASSTQRQTALGTYWQSVLMMNRNDLPAFLEAFKAAPVLLPFDATSSPGGQAISDLLTDAVNKTFSFPPPIGCYPGLSSTQLQRINAVETEAFGLPALTASPSTFDTSCFANHPVYGILDVLRIRLPFSDSRGGVAKQAAVLTPDAASRVILHVGELLSALPAPSDTDLSPFDIDPRQFGTLSHINHIALEWLQSFPTTAIAADAAGFVLSSPSSPPSSNSSLFNSTFIPTVEVAVLGNVLLSDVSSFVSSLSTPSGSLFFGSPQGQAFRRWALQQSSPATPATISWSESAFANETVREGSSTNDVFERIWSGASSLPLGSASSVEPVVEALINAGLFSS